MSKDFQCPDCGYIYRNEDGCPREGYPKGTPWDDLPKDFPCPDCFVREKPDFIAIDKT
ncbi:MULTISPECIES: rubredoxin [Spongiibacter]|jgi:rubredoxin|uniref:rubredoxin n=1 Tax=Spongiibacter TaxID=630749 RepID=UPI001E5DFDC9|nr:MULTISPECIES: rubredoxin [Spongiibacter]MBM7424800.1 rubredoxin [Spongiibacter marinus]